MCVEREKGGHRNEGERKLCQGQEREVEGGAVSLIVDDDGLEAKAVSLLLQIAGN